MSQVASLQLHPRPAISTATPLLPLPVDRPSLRTGQPSAQRPDCCHCQCWYQCLLLFAVLSPSLFPTLHLSLPGPLPTVDVASGELAAAPPASHQHSDPTAAIASCYY